MRVIGSEYGAGRTIRLLPGRLRARHTSGMGAAARYRQDSGVVVRDGVRIGYDVYGDGPATVLLLPAWSLIDSRIWRMQVPYLARHFRVVTFDPRGNGRSDRPTGAAAYADDQFAADAIGVLDATHTDQAVLAGLSAGARWALQVAAEHPARVLGLFAIDPAVTFTTADRDGRLAAFEASYTGTGWRDMYNRQCWLEGDFDGFREAFTRQVFVEPHSSKPIEDCLEFQDGVTPQMLVDTVYGRLGVHGSRYRPVAPVCARVRCPVQVVHGSDDAIASPDAGRRLAELTGGSFTLLEGSGHSPNARSPVRVNLMLREFVEEVASCAPRPTGRSRSRPRRGPRVLYSSSPIGLGHARRDIAVAAELRRHHPDVEVDWLAQPPVSTALAAAGERVHPASGALASESDHVESESGEHDLHVFEAYRRMDDILLHNFHVFHDVLDEERYDVVVGDEAWDLDYFLHENPRLKRFGFAWFTDFVGMLPMADGGAREAALCADYNADMIRQRERYPGIRDRAIFVGRADDVVPGSFGPGLPDIREWTTQQFRFAGYVTGFVPPGEEEVHAARARLRLGPDDRLCVVAVGGTSVGRPLLERVLDAVPLVRRRCPALHFLVVTGPRIDPGSLPRRRGVRMRGYIPDLYRYLAACDLAVVQGGLTTCMELAASGTPFVYVPLEHHFEQQLHVRHRLEQYGAGRHLAYHDACDPEVLADVISTELAGQPPPRPVETDGAARAAELLSDLL